MEVVGAAQTGRIIRAEPGTAVELVYAVHRAVISPRRTTLLAVIALLALSIAVALPTAHRMIETNWSVGCIVLWLVRAPVLTALAMIVVLGVLGHVLFVIASFVERRSRSRK